MTVRASTIATRPAHRLNQLASHLASPPLDASSPASNPSPPSPVRVPTKPRPAAPGSSSFRYFLPFQSRWADNDSYSHFNNVVYSQYFDSITNEYILHHTPRDPRSPIGLIVHSETSYASELKYPNPIVAALSISQLSKRKVVWRIGLFEGEWVEDDDDERGTRRGRSDESDVGATSKSGGRVSDGESVTGFGKKVRIKRVPRRSTTPRTLDDVERRRSTTDRGTDEEVKASAWGTMTHVFVDRESRKVVDELDDGFRKALERLVVPEGSERT
ncbi:hypothetical protein JCM10212_000421 [Sporobolomyces blumeae]